MKHTDTVETQGSDDQPLRSTLKAGCNIDVGAPAYGNQCYGQCIRPNHCIQADKWQVMLKFLYFLEKRKLINVRGCGD